MFWRWSECEMQKLDISDTKSLEFQFPLQELQSDMQANYTWSLVCSDFRTKCYWFIGVCIPVKRSQRKSLQTKHIKWKRNLLKTRISCFAWWQSSQERVGHVKRMSSDFFIGLSSMLFIEFQPHNYIHIALKSDGWSLTKWMSDSRNCEGSNRTIHPVQSVYLSISHCK